MGKLPSFQWYPGDWMKDPNVRRCSPAARGVWMDMLCLMFECEDRGVLLAGDQPWSDEEIAAAVTGPTDVVLSCISELLSKGVCSRNKSGAIFSKRMVRDELERKKWRKDKDLQRNSVRDLSTSMSTDCPPPLSSSSSSSSSKHLKPRPQKARPVQPPFRNESQTLTPQQIEYGRVSKLITGAMSLLAHAKAFGAPKNGDLKEDLKQWAADHNIPYDADSIRKALDVAEEKAKALA